MTPAIHRILRRDFGRNGLRGVAGEGSAGDRPRNREAALEVPRHRFPSANPPGVYEGMVYVGDLNGVLHAVHAADGRGLWTFKTEAEIRSSPVVAGDRLLIGSLRRQPLLPLAAEWQAPLEIHHQQLRAWEPRRSRSGVAYVSGCDEISTESAWRMARRWYSSPPAARRRFSGAPRRVGLVRQLQPMKWWAPACARSAFYGATAEGRPVSVLTPRRPRLATASFWAAATKLIPLPERENR